MDEVSSRPEKRPRRHGRLSRILVAGLVVISLLCGSWLVAGNARVGGFARDYFLAHQGTSTVVNLTIDAESPWVPPFWSVRISGDVVEQDGSSAVYRSYMWLLVEPATGLVVSNGAG